MTSRPVDFAARFLMRAAVAAPSIHNTQPWRFAAYPGGVELYADPARRLAVADATGREMVISCGAALLNLRLAMRHLGFAPNVRLIPDLARPDLLARVDWGVRTPPTPYEERLFTWITRRHTHRGPFRPGLVPPVLIADLQYVARQEYAALYVITGDPERLRLAGLILDAERAERADPGYATEQARWARPPGDPGRDGLLPGSYPAQPDGPLFVSRDFAAGEPWGFRTRARHHDSGTLGTVAVLASAGDAPSDWLLTGQALQRILLDAAASDVRAAFHTQPLELPRPRREIAQEFAHGRFPQMIMRLGYTSRTLPSRRRPLAEVVARAHA